jgi:hypothetical protein
MLHAAVRTLTCCTCCAACRDALRMQAASPRSHHGERVRSGVPQRAPRADGAPEGPLSLAALLVRSRAWPRLAWCSLCSSSALSAALGRLRASSMAASATPATTQRSGRRPQLLQRPLLRRRLLRCRRCSPRMQAATLACRSVSVQLLSYSRSKACREAPSRSRWAPPCPPCVAG